MSTARCHAACPLPGHQGQRCYRQRGHDGDHENLAVWWSDDGESGHKGRFDREHRKVERWSPPTEETEVDG